MNQKQISKESQPSKAQKLVQNQKQKLFPLDLHLVLGENSNGQQLLKVDILLQLKPQKIQELAFNSDIDYDSIGKDMIIKFDFVTQEGREKEVIEYFENGLDRYPRDDYDNNLSPLQNWFVRPTKNGKLQLTESKRNDGKKGVTLFYQLYTEQMEDMQDLELFVDKLGEGEFKPDAKCSLVLKGHLDTFKKNRIRINADYINIHLISKQFQMNKLLAFMKIFQMFGDEQAAQQVIQNPIFKILEQAQQIQGTLKMAALRKLLELYKLGIQNSGKQFEKQSPEVIKGLFKSQLRFTFIYQGRLALSATIQYHSQSILIRLLTSFKKYLSFLD